MTKIYCLLAGLLLIFSTAIFAQNPNKTTIRGTVKDTSGEAIPLPTVMLLNPADSTLVNFTRGDEQGVFQFKNVKNNPYLLKITYVGYLPLQRYLPASAADVNELGDIPIKTISKELLEVVIRDARSTLSIRGDTIEYDASSFKVPPGSTVEDLLRRLPGIEVDADGNIRAQGQDVKRVYVDGKTFFGDDPKAATKNLGAETLSKIQVYNDKSEQSKLTGVDDGKKEKAMNLELKEEYKKGQFGKITAGAGTLDRWVARGNFNRFNEKEQFSVIGYANNINQTGVNWDDYREFKGQNSFNDYDNGDFGFGNAGGMTYYFDSGDNPTNNYDGRGLTENAGGGANWNFDNKKTKANANYFYNQTALDLTQFQDRQTFLSDSSFFNSDTTSNLDFRRNHSLAGRIEQNLDSNNVLIVKVNGRLGNSTNERSAAQGFRNDDETPVSHLSTDEDNSLGTWRLSTSAIFRHRFPKKGRSLLVSGAYNGNQSDGREQLFTLNEFFLADTQQQIRMLNTSDRNTAQFKSSALFSEKLSQKWYWETFYNFSTTQNLVDRQVGDPENEFRRVDSLSVFYDNDIRFNRLGSSVRYSHGGLNTNVGLAGQQIEIGGKYAVAEGMPLLSEPVSRRFQNLTPNFNLNYETKSNMYLRIGYNYNIREPQLTDLQPIPNVNNRAFRVEGNPGLTPERYHEFSANINQWRAASMSSLGIGANYSIYDNRIVYNQKFKVEEGSPVQTTVPANVRGGSNFNLYSWSNFPIVKTKLTMNMNPSINYNFTPGLVNNARNDTRRWNARFGAGLNFTPNQKLIVGLGGSLNYTDIQYSIGADQNIWNYGANTSAKWQFLPRTFFEGSFNYDFFRNERLDFRREIPILNASVRQLLGKQNRVEMRLAAFDIFNKRLTINQFGTQNYVTKTLSNTLARYFMVSMSYNLKGYESKLERNNYW